MNNRETPIPDGSAEAGNDWQETLKARHEQINNESDSADSEIGRTKIYIGELIEIHKEGSLIPAAKNVEGSAIHVAFIERVMQTDVATAILSDFQEGWGFDTHISDKRKRIQVFYEKVAKKLDELDKQNEENIELVSLDRFKKSSPEEQLKTLEALKETIEGEEGAKGSEFIAEQYQRELSILERIHNKMHPFVEADKEEKSEDLQEFDTLDEYLAEVKRRKEGDDAEGAISIAKRGILKFPESGLLWMELANMLARSLENYNEAFHAWLNTIVYNTNFVNKYLFMNLHKTSSYSEEKMEDAILKIVDDMRMLEKTEESDIFLKRAMEVYEDHTDKFNAVLTSVGCDEEFSSDEAEPVAEEEGKKQDSERLISFTRFKMLPYDEMLKTIEDTKKTIKKEDKTKGNEAIVKQYKEELIELEKILREKLEKYSSFRELSPEEQEEEITKSRELLEEERGNPDREREVKKFEVELTFLVAIHQEMMSSTEAKKNLERVISEKSKIEKALKIAEKKAVNSENRAEVFKRGLDDLVEAHKEEIKDMDKKILDLYGKMSKLEESSKNVNRERITLEATLLAREIESAGMEGENLGKDFKIAEMNEKLERAKKNLEKTNNDVDRARQTALSSSPPPPDSLDGKLVTRNQELQKKVEELENQIAENEIENANFPHQIELLKSEVKRLEEYIDEINKLPAPEVNAISESIKEKEVLRAKIKELEKKAEEQKKAVQDASAVALEKETLAQKVEKLEKEIEEQKQFIESVISVTGSIVPPAPDDIASINSLNESNKLTIEQLEIELGQAETGNNTLRARVEELEKISAELRRKLKEATGISSVPPPPKLLQRIPPVQPPVRAGSPARSSSKPPVPNGTSLPKPSATSSSTPPPSPRIPFPPVPKSARQSTDEPSVVVSLDYIGDIKKVENKKVGNRLRRILRKLFTEVD